MELLSPPTSQVNSIAASRPTSPPDATPVAVEDQLQIKDTEEVVGEDHERSSTPAVKAAVNGTPAPTAEINQEAIQYEPSRFEPINGGERNKHTPPASGEPADEIVVDVRDRKGSMGAKASKNVDDKPKVNMEDGKGADDDDEVPVPGPRVSKRKRISRYFPDPELDALLDELEHGDDGEQFTNRPARFRKTPRGTSLEKLPETQAQNSADPGTSPAQFAFSGPEVTAKKPPRSSNGSMVPLNAPLRPARRGPNNNNPSNRNTQPLLNHEQSLLNHTTSRKSAAMDSLLQYNSESELSEPVSPTTMENTTPITTTENAASTVDKAASTMENTTPDTATENTTPATTAGPAEEPQLQADPATAPELPADEVEAQAEVKTEPLPDLNRIVLGYWKGSSEADPANKHAIVGVLGSNKQLRARLLKLTRDGRPITGNHPHGAGGVWRGWDEIEFEGHIRHLTRLQLKEYVRIRQEQKTKGELPEDEAANQATALKAAESIPTDGQPRVCDFVAPPKAATPEPKSLKRKSIASAASTKAARVKRTPTQAELDERALHFVQKNTEIALRRNAERLGSSSKTPTPARLAATPAASDFEDGSPGPSRRPAASRSASTAIPSGREVLAAAMPDLNCQWEASNEGIEQSNIKVYNGQRFHKRKAEAFARPGTDLFITVPQVATIGGEDYVVSQVLRRVGGG
ncbi:hypothetical protein GE09DRAFT_48173 [Coniochaeta sp. 2T2.1]|nr:hypothetical protein GE09DRAFT_48173 [Coniochaeta sp. 2T2.1]